MAGFFSFAQQQQLCQDSYLPANPGLSESAGITGTAGAGQAAEEVRSAQRRGGGVVRPSKHIRICRVDSNILASLQEQLQTGFAVGRKNEGLHSSTLALDPDSGEVRKNQALKGRQGGLQGRESRRGSGRDRNGALWGDASTILVYGQLGDFTLAAPVVENEKGQAGVAEETPGFSRLQLPGQGQEGGVLQPPQVQHQRGQGGQQGQQVVTPRAAGDRGRRGESLHS